MAKLFNTDEYVPKERFHRLGFYSLSPTSTVFFSRTYDVHKNDFVKPKIRLADGSEVEVRPPSSKSGLNVHSGYLSRKAISNIKRSVNTLLCGVDENIMLTGAGKEKITFATLTLASEQIKSYHEDYVEHYADDKEIKKECFNQLMTELRQLKGVENYVWKAEKQLNGNLHFHILLDKRIDKDWLRERWNKLQNKFGFVERYAQKMRPLSYRQYYDLRMSQMKPLPANATDKMKKKRAKTIANMPNAYKYGVDTDWQNPNSTDIETLKDIDNVASYIAKYMAKSENDEKAENSKIEAEKVRLQEKYGTNLVVLNMFVFGIRGRIWQCSQSISKARKCVVYAEPEYGNEISTMVEHEKEKVRVFADEPEIDENTGKLKENLFVTVVHSFKQLNFYCKQIYEVYISHIKRFFGEVAENIVDSVTDTVRVAGAVAVGVPVTDVHSSKVFQTRFSFGI